MRFYFLKHFLFLSLAFFNLSAHISMLLLTSLKSLLFFSSKLTLILSNTSFNNMVKTMMVKSKDLFCTFSASTSKIKNKWTKRIKHLLLIKFVYQEFLPEILSKKAFFEPSENVNEQKIREKMKVLWGEKYGY